jgi:hypothetical protein
VAFLALSKLSTHNPGKAMIIIKTTGKLPWFMGAVLALAANAAAQSFPGEGLLAYYPFSGNADDATGNGHDGVVSNAVLTTNRFGQANSAYAFNGTNSMIVVSNSADLEPLADFSVSVWAEVVKAPVVTFQQQIYAPLLSKNVAGQNSSGWMLQIVPSNAIPVIEPPFTGLRLTFEAPPFFNYITSPHINVPTNTWFQAVFTFQRTSGNVQEAMGTCNFYLNGVLADSRPEPMIENNDPVPLIMGAGGGGFATVAYPYHFDGLLDDIRIYDRALSSNEVQQLYVAEASPPVQPQVDTHKAIQLSFSQLTVGVQYQLQFSHNRRRWLDAGAPFTATATTQSEYLTTGDLDLRDVDWRLRVAP